MEPNANTKVITRPDPVVADPQLEEEIKPKLPPLWRVVLINNNTTPFEYVHMVHREVFDMNPQAAYNAMMTAHRIGRCTIIVTTHEKANSYLEEVNQMNQLHGHTELTYIMEEEEDDQS